MCAWVHSISATRGRSKPVIFFIARFDWILNRFKRAVNWRGTAWPRTPNRHGLISEKYGVIDMHFKVVARGVTLHYEVVAIKLFGLTIPPSLLFQADEVIQ